MQKKLGGILKINRIRYGLSLSNVSNRTGIAESQLSRYERNNESLSYNNVQKICKFLNIKISEDDISKEFESDFYHFYESIAYDKDYEIQYQKIKEYQDIIQMSSSYVKYLLAEMIYCNLNASFVNLNDYTYLENYFDYLEAYQIQIYYDFLVVFSYFNNENYKTAQEYISLAEKSKGNNITKSMFFYHKAIVLNRAGDLTNALMAAKEAHSLFASSLNLKRLVQCSYLLAMIFANMNNFLVAEELYKKCLSAFKCLGMKTEIKDTYNNLFWCYMRSQNYRKIIDYKDCAIEETQNDCCIFYYISYAYFKLNNIKDAKFYISLADQIEDDTSDFMKVLIHSFNIFLNSTSSKKKETHLINAYKAAIKEQRKADAIFILNSIIEFYRNENDVKNENFYMKKLLSLT